MNYKTPSIEEMLKAGVHFGHQTRRWNPLMKEFIYGAENKSHIIDVYKSEQKLKEACDFLYNIAKSGKKILFVGTKRQARKPLLDAAKKTNSYYVLERWLGGTFTNFNSVNKNIKELDTLIENKKAGKYSKYTKKENLLLDRKIAKLEKFYGGLRDLNKDVGAMVVIDVKKEHTAIKEAKELNIPVCAIVDTNSNPKLIDYIIPSNDDAIKAIELIVSVISDAIASGQKAYMDEKDKPKIEEVKKPVANEVKTEKNTKEPSVKDEPKKEVKAAPKKVTKKVLKK